MTIDPFISGSGVVLMAIVGYFLRRLHVQVDDTSKALASFRIEVNDKFDRMEDKIVTTMKEMCHERQASCGRLQDAKIESVQNACKSQCHKIGTMMEDREKRWEKQDILNDQIKNHLAKNHV